MYLNHFGLKQPGFSITPDPHYLYLSQEHREALAHLLYGAGEGGGFVLLTGEVGTGKTTICRTFLEQLPEQVDVALILNPALSAPDLLYSICEEFGIPLPDGPYTTRLLLNLLNSYLLSAHANHRRPVLLIDEAQNLGPEVLEQIRLLTNLETHTHKLLQIFLIGQPELRKLLEQRDLRQLSQRITARYHLLPLSAGETSGYINHRLKVAGVNRPLFTGSAINQIYRSSGGVPRLINMLCDRALLGAYASQRRVVDRQIAIKAARELQGQRESPTDSRAVRILVSLSVLLVCIGLLAYAWKGRWSPPATILQQSTAPASPLAGELTGGISRQATSLRQKGNQPPLQSEQTAEEDFSQQTGDAPKEKSAGTQSGTAATTPAMGDRVPSSADRPPESAGPDPVATHNSLLDSTSPEEISGFALDKSAALLQLLSLWGHNLSGVEPYDICASASTAGLRCRKRNGGWDMIRSYDRPALIRLENRGGEAVYILITGLDRLNATLYRNRVRRSFPLAALDRFWQGDFLFLWQPPPDGVLLIGPRSPEKQVRWLRQTLGRIPGWAANETDSDRFDRVLQDEIRRFQRHHGLAPDGLVGPDTLIHLNSAASIPGIPRLGTYP